MSPRRPWLIALTPLYTLGAVLKRKMYAHGLLSQKRLEKPVISVGSISAGGAGKTPFVAMLAQLLEQKGYAVSILTRGYKRASTAIERVRAFDDPAWHGDEPVLLAAATGVPVFVGADRYEAGLVAEKECGDGRIAVHLLDDGFQHMRLARNLDIVLLTREDVDDLVLPAGNLREPVSAVAAADIVVVREDEVAALREDLDALREDSEKMVVWMIRRSLALFEEEVALPTLPLAFCGVARPENFTRMLTESRYEPMETVAFADHHAYTDADIESLIGRAERIGANGFVTTEKDAVKLTAAMRARLESVGPIITARLKVKLLNEKEALGQLVTKVEQMDRRKGTRLMF